MKIFLLIYVISTGAGQQPVVQRIEEPNMEACEGNARQVHRQMPNGCEGVQFCRPVFVVKTACVTSAAP